MEIKTLKDVPVAEIAAVFNEAFRGYFIPLAFTEETMAAKIRSEGIDLSYSIGAFENDKLVGFILHGYDIVNGVKTIYNGGTGVIASHRGKGLTAAMYDFCIPLLLQQGIRHHILEVIDENRMAMNIYLKTGFTTVREFKAYKGALTATNESMLLMKELDKIPHHMITLFEVQPSWQNSVRSVERDRDAHKIIGAYKDDELVAFGTFIPATGRVKQVFVLPAYRRQGIAKTLFQYMQTNSNSAQLMVTNVDSSYIPANQFLEALGFQNFLGLYEMKMEVK